MLKYNSAIFRMIYVVNIEGKGDFTPNNVQRRTMKIKRIVVNGFTFLLFTLLLTLAFATAFAGTIRVPTDWTTIQAAILAANDGDTIQVAQGVYAENISVTSSKHISIQGGWSQAFTCRSDDSSLTIIDAGGNGQVINIRADTGVTIKLTIDGFTIQNGTADQGAGIGALSLNKNSYLSLTLNNNRIIGNSSTKQSEFDGGGIWAKSVGNGAVAELILTNNLIKNNSSLSGGGLAAESQDGGGIIVTLTDNIISWNTAEFGGGIWLNSAHAGSTTMVTLTRNVISNNRAPNLDGGGLAAYASGANANTTLLFEKNIVTENEGAYGGGLWFYSWGKDSVIDVTLTNNIVADNYAPAMFGGIAITSADNAHGYLRMRNNSVTANVAADHAGIFINTGCGLFLDPDMSEVSVSMLNDIVWGNIGSPESYDITLWADTTSSVINLTASYSNIGQILNYQDRGIYTPDHMINGDPLFFAPETDDYHLMANSPCIDSGTSQGAPTTDLEGNSRPQGAGYDMGAYEFVSSSSPPSVSTDAATSVTSCSATLNGTVNPNGTSTTVPFEYGTTISYGKTVTATQSPLTGTNSQSASVGVMGLTAGTTYHFRAKGTNSAGTGYGSDMSFKTSYASTLYVSQDGNCGGKTPCFTSIQEAINTAGTGAAIRIAQGSYSESIDLIISKSLTLQGGWNSSFATQTANTTFIKAPKAPQGSLTLQMVTIRP